MAIQWTGRPTENSEGQRRHRIMRDNTYIPPLSKTSYESIDRSLSQIRNLAIANYGRGGIGHSEILEEMRSTVTWRYTAYTPPYGKWGTGHSG